MAAICGCPILSPLLRKGGSEESLRSMRWAQVSSCQNFNSRKKNAPEQEVHSGALVHSLQFTSGRTRG
jgi:hypothetical protein